MVTLLVGSSPVAILSHRIEILSKSAIFKDYIALPSLARYRLHRYESNWLWRRRGSSGGGGGAVATDA